MSNTTASEDVDKALGGDLAAFSQVLEHPATVVAHGEGGAHPHLLTAEAVRHVLEQLRREKASPELVQRWASFARRGYIEGRHSGPVRPLPIEYEPRAESRIASILSRLDEIGDTVDGDVTAGEVAEMLGLLAVFP